MANILMGVKLDPIKVERKSIASVSVEDIKKAKEEGGRIKYLCKAERDESGAVRLSVLPTKVPFDDVYATVNGSSTVVTLYTDLAGELTINRSSPYSEWFRQRFELRISPDRYLNRRFPFVPG